MKPLLLLQLIALPLARILYGSRGWNVAPRSRLRLQGGVEDLRQLGDFGFNQVQTLLVVV
jgi:hypothetical protein